jgi:imidazolonepropionase-like amidohydrolase
MKKLISIIYLSLLSNVLSAQSAPSKIVINNVQIFNGKDNKIVKGNILIEGNLIKTITSMPIVIDNSSGVKVIDGHGKYLMPGLIDAHVHLLFESVPQMQALMSDYAMLNLMAAKASVTYLRSMIIQIGSLLCKV